MKRRDNKKSSPENVNAQVNVDINIKKIFVIAVIVYVFLVLSFYYLAGDQLHYRNSRGNFQQPAAESGTVELYKGNSVEQAFSVEIQRLYSISVQWGTYYRANSGTVTMELVNLADGSMVMSQNFNAGEITEGGLTTMSVEEPIENIYGAPLLLRLYSDSEPGFAVSPMMSLSAEEEDFSLSLNGTPTNGILCFSALGEDYIWTGIHYWEFAVCFGTILVLMCAAVWLRWKKCGKSYVVNVFIAVKKYKFLIHQLVSRDFKTKYKRSLLGVLWSFLNPLLTMVVQYVVFSNLFRFDLPNYPAYLIIGIVLFNFFSESTGMALTSIIGNAGLITKVYMPKYIYPLTRVMSSLVNLLISLIPLLIVTFISGIMPAKSFLLVPYVLICLTIFCLGVGLFLAAAMVFFRDIQFLWGVVSMIWMYLTPIFYPISILPDSVAWILKFNPLYYFITFARTCIMDGISPEPIVYVQCMAMSMLTLLVGGIVFKSTQNKFVLYL